MKELYYKIGTKLAILPVLFAPKATFAQAFWVKMNFSAVLVQKNLLVKQVWEQLICPPPLLLSSAPSSDF